MTSWGLLVLLAAPVPLSPDEALSQLDRFGPVPECHMEEQIEETPLGHRHHFSPPKVLPLLKGRAETLLPYLQHPSRRVVVRAVALLCHAGGDEGPNAVHALAKRYPCERAIGEAAEAMFPDRELADQRSRCPYNPPGARAAAARLSAKRTTVDANLPVEQLVWQLDDLEEQRARSAVVALAQLDTPAAALSTWRGLTGLLGRALSTEAGDLLRGFVGVQLDNIAARAHTNRSGAFCSVAGVAAADDLETLTTLERQRELWRSRLTRARGRKAAAR